MSGVEIIVNCVELAKLAKEVASYIKEFIDGGRHYHERLYKLHSKLYSLQDTLGQFRDAAERIKSASENSQGQSKAAVAKAKAESIIRRDLKHSRQTLGGLCHCWGKLNKSKNGSVIKRAVEYWCFEQDGKKIVERGLHEIEERLISMDRSLQCVQIHLLYDILGVVSPPLSRRTTDASIDTNEKPIIESVELPNFDDLETLVDPDEDLWSLDDVFTDRPGTSALSRTIIFAIEEKDRTQVSKLLKSGDDPLGKDDDGWCALHHAVRADSKRVMRELLNSAKLKEDKNGVDMKDKNGATALQFSAAIGKKAMAKELLEAGADVNALDNHNRSPLFMAVEGNNDGMVEFLLDHKAKATANIPPRFKEIQRAINFRKQMAAKKR